jgi:hypothetical protein
LGVDISFVPRDWLAEHFFLFYRFKNRFEPSGIRNDDSQPLGGERFAVANEVEGG